MSSASSSMIYNFFWSCKTYVTLVTCSLHFSNFYTVFFMFYNISCAPLGHNWLMWMQSCLQPPWRYLVWRVQTGLLPPFISCGLEGVRLVAPGQNSKLRKNFVTNESKFVTVCQFWTKKVAKHTKKSQRTFKNFPNSHFMKKKCCKNVTSL